MKKTLPKRILQFLFLVTVLLSVNNTFAQPGGYAFRLQSNNNFGTAYVLTNNSPATGILSTTVQAASTAGNYLIEWDSFANKWSNTNTLKNTLQTFNWGGGSFNGPDGVLNGSFQIGKRYTLQLRGLSYSNRQGVIMETDNAPQSFHATASTAVSTPSNVCSGTSTTITITLAGAKSPQERVFIRYAINGNFGSSKVVEATGSGSTWTTATATIPAIDNAVGTTINYYAYTTTVAAVNGSDHDLITLRFGNNGGSNYAYSVLTSITYYTDADGDGFGNFLAPISSCTGAPTVSGNLAVLNSSDCNDAVIYYTDADGDGFGVLPLLACGSVTNNSDCNDGATYYTDADADGYGALPLLACGSVTNNSDCNDAVIYYTDADGDGFGIVPLLPCGSITNNSDCNDGATYYTDADGDGFGVLPLLACGSVTNNSDCNDTVIYYTDADGDGFGVLPLLACGSITNNSDCNDGATHYTDADGDGFGVLPLLACGSVTNNSDCNDNQFQYLDSDGDGFGSTTPVACGVPNSSDCNDNQLQYLDADNDGFGSVTQVACGVTNNSDCNDNQFQYLDSDGDGFGSTTPVACGVPNSTDCNDNQLQYLDADNDGFGSVTQVACGVTNNNDCNDNQFQYLDADGDGFGSTTPVACGVPNSSDCNDNQLQYLDADNDGFGSVTQVACGVTNNSDCNDNQFQYLDADGDGFGSITPVACGVPNNSDCNDNQLQYLDADNDGFGSVTLVACGVTSNNDCNDNQFQYLDADGDGFGSTTPVACGVTNNSDCNDNQLQYLDADNDGFGSVTLVACGVTSNNDCNDNQFQYLDADGDGFGSTTPVACGVTNNSDCNDNQLQYLDVDNDGFGSVTLVACGATNNSDCNDNQFQYLDADGDGFGSITLVACGVPNNSDCNDNQLQYLDADNDGFGSVTLVACGVTSNNDCNDNQFQYLDADGDGFGSTTPVACGVANSSDCNDNQLQYLDADNDGFGSVTQVACGVSNNSDCNDNQFQYLDSDGDGFGSNVLVACGVLNNSDCNDNQLQYLDADNDSFGSTTQVPCGVTNSSDCNDNQIQYVDADSDGYGTTTQSACGVTNSTDCDDTNFNVNSGITEICNGIDDNCDGNIDEGVAPLCQNGGMVVNCGCSCPSGYVGVLCEIAVDSDSDGVPNISDCSPFNPLIYQSALLYTDADGDGYHVSAAVTCYGATLPAGTSLTTLGSGDCNDNNPAVHPGAIDVCGDGIDNDCNGIIDNVGQPGGCIPTVNSFTIGTSCGSMVSSLSVTIIAAIVPGATTYTFRITNMVTNAVFVVNRPVNSFALSNYAGITLGTQYQVQVSVNGGATYGPPCIVYTPAPTSTIGAQCGTALTSMTQFVYATYAASVTGYRFRVTNTSTSGVHVYTALSGQNRFSFSQLPATFASFGTTYSVEVALRNTDGTYLPYGLACNITTPVFPTSEVVLSQCDYTATSSTQSIAAVVVSGATGYRFQLTNASLSYAFSVDRTVNQFSLSLFPGLVNGTTYTVRVAVRIGGVWGPLTGKPCNLTTPGSAPGGERLVTVNNYFKAVAYPNPFADNFMFDVITTTQSSIQVRVYDMLGKEVENRNVDASEINTISFGENYPSGVYNVIVSQDDKVQSLRVIKR